MATVTVRYVDGSTIEGPPSEWVAFRGDGVDEVWFEVAPERGTRMRGHSVYWCYREDDAWVIGCGTVGDQPLTVEAVYHDDGTTEDRPMSWFPDLPHDAVKLGWWYPGTAGEVIG